MKVNKLFVVSYKVFAVLFMTVFALGATSCKDDTWSKTYGPVEEIVTANNEGWTLESEDNFTYPNIAELKSNWDIVASNTKEEWSTYGVPTPTIERPAYINPEIGDKYAEIINNNLVLRAFAQDLYSNVETKTEEGGKVVKVYTYLTYTKDESVLTTSTGKSVKIIEGGDAADKIPGLGGVIYSHLKVGKSASEKELEKPIRIEFKAKVQGGKNACPMIYLIPANPRNKVDMTKGRDEIAKMRNMNGFIRVMEYYNTNDFAMQSLNSNYITNWGQLEPKSNVQPKIDKANFNTYMVEISNKEVSMYVNNIRTLYYPLFDAGSQKPTTDRFPFAQEYNIILGVGMGTPPVEAKQTFSFGTASMEVDYIKYYTKNK